MSWQENFTAAATNPESQEGRAQEKYRFPRAPVCLDSPGSCCRHVGCGDPFPQPPPRNMQEKDLPSTLKRVTSRSVK